MFSEIMACCAQNICLQLLRKCAGQRLKPLELHMVRDRGAWRGRGVRPPFGCRRLRARLRTRAPGRAAARPLLARLLRVR